jgi:hypothetical protein
LLPREETNLDSFYRIIVTTQRYTSGILNREETIQTEYKLKITARNIGQVYAKYVKAFIKVLYEIAYRDEFEPEEPTEENGELFCEYYQDNTERDVVDVEFNIYASIKKYGPSWFDPILPGLHHTWRIRVSDNFPSKEIEGLLIKWSVHADNAPPNAGSIAVEDIKVVDLRES